MHNTFKVKLANQLASHKDWQDVPPHSVLILDYTQQSSWRKKVEKHQDVFTLCMVGFQGSEWKQAGSANIAEEKLTMFPKNC